MSSLDNLLSQEISDEAAVIVSDLLFEMFWVWECAHGDQIQRHHQSTSPTLVDPPPAWTSAQTLYNEKRKEFDDELPF